MTKRNKWTNNEIYFLKEKYESNGVNYVMNNLTQHTRNSIIKKAKSLGLKVDKSIYSYDYLEVKTAVNESFNYKEVLDKLNKTSSGNAYKFLINYINKKSIDVSHFNSLNKEKKKKFTINEIFKINPSYKGGTKELKKIILKNNLIEYKCHGENCEIIDNWNGKSISLHLDHKNGINNDNRLENLRFLCPNCHSQTETYSGKNKKTIHPSSNGGDVRFSI